MIDLLPNKNVREGDALENGDNVFTHRQPTVRGKPS
jgi:hypothetical protein